MILVADGYRDDSQDRRETLEVFTILSGTVKITGQRVSQRGDDKNLFYFGRKENDKRRV